ncbi:MAG: YggT family protein [Chloroflexi bacterium]|nr:YggT family protein [Chloroflexota bacterium]MBV9543575.1 YggT family protein [Chloroflexota bacterium]
MEEERTEVIQNPPADRAAAPARVTQVTNETAAPARTHVDSQEAVAYDVYENRRLAAYRLTQLIYWIFGLIEALILIRFVLKALGANPSAGFAQFIYAITAPLVAPFINLFGNPQTQGSVLELNSIIALVVYALVAYLLAKLAWIIVGDTRSAVKTHSRSVDSRL